MSTTMVDRLNGVAEGLAVKVAVRAATTGSITLLGEQTIDTVAVVAGDRVLVKDQNDPTQNGIWVASTGAWKRATDFDGARDVVKGTRVYVNEGDTYPIGNAGTEWYVTTAGAIVFGTSAIAFALVAASAIKLATDWAEKTDGPVSGIAGQYSAKYWSQVLNGTILAAVTGAPRIVTAGPVTAAVDDYRIVLNLTVSADVSFQLPAVAARLPLGLPLEIYDFAGNAGQLTISPNGSELIMGANTPWTVTAAFGAQSGRALLLIPSVDLNGWTVR